MAHGGARRQLLDVQEPALCVGSRTQTRLRGMADHEIPHTLNHQPKLVGGELVTPSTGRLLPQVEPAPYLPRGADKKGGKDQRDMECDRVRSRTAPPFPSFETDREAFLEEW